MKTSWPYGTVNMITSADSSGEGIFFLSLSLLSSHHFQVSSSYSVDSKTLFYATQYMIFLKTSSSGPTVLPEWERDWNLWRSMCWRVTKTVIWCVCGYFNTFFHSTLFFFLIPYFISFSFFKYKRFLLSISKLYTLEKYFSRASFSSIFVASFNEDTDGREGRIFKITDEECNSS